MPRTTKRRRSASPLPGSSSNKAAKASSSSRPPANSTQSLSAKEWRQWKRQQIHDYNTHQFLDASATVRAGLFGARRLPEIKSLWRQMVQGELNTPNVKSNDRTTATIRRAGKCGGGKLSSRHLRRRTNSHRPRRRYRYRPPRGKGDSSGDGVGLKEELVKCSDCNAMGDNAINAVHSDRSMLQRKQKCRRARRKPALLKLSHSHWWHPQTHNTQMNAPEAPHKWVPSHLWHAKRFHVSPPLFSWSIPLIHSNRGSRASLRLASSETHPKCTIQDATWEVNGCAIQLSVNKVDSSPQSTEQPTLISILEHLCGPDAQFLNEENIVMGKQAGEGLIYEVNACPLKPIGPATFMFGKSWPGNGSVNVSILTHPAIHQRVISLITAILPSDVDSNTKVTLSSVPLALLRVRGRASTSTISAVLEHAESISLLNRDVHHGTLIEIGTSPPLTDSKQISNTITQKSLMLLKSHIPNQSYQHLPHNLASSGWDILCHPSTCSSLFQSFVTSGGACAIGLAEDSRANLEAYPPLPLFPRDYPDTDEGKAYWEGRDASTASLTEKESSDKKLPRAAWKDWAVIRACIEGSWGKINTPLKRTIRHWKEYDTHQQRGVGKEKSSAAPGESSLELTKDSTFGGANRVLIHWSSLISTDEESTVVVRGSFGIPFLQLLNGCGRLCQPSSGSNLTESKDRRRPRRKVRPPNSIVHASPLSLKVSEAHSSFCQQLKASLSLPALLRCELYCEGKGTLEVGNLILSLVSKNDGIGDVSNFDDGVGNDDVNDEKTRASVPLGVVVAGGFSPSRGKCHGIGFVGAAKLIGSLDGTSHGIGMTIPKSNGQKVMMLKVVVAKSCAECGRHALLSILL